MTRVTVNRIYLVQCSATKRASRSKARDLYSSPLFKKSFALSSSDPNGQTYILSALHGLVSPEADLDPYDVTLNTMNRLEKRAWGLMVAEQIERLCADPSEIVMLAGSAYADPLMPFLQSKFERVFRPMSGLGIGRRLSWLDRAQKCGARIAVDLEEFYYQLERAISAIGGVKELAELTGIKDLPKAGVYFFFEPGEVRLSGKPRVVRVGTHAVSAGSKATLRSRLRTHLGTAAGLGSHRSSVFRRHVGVAIAKNRGVAAPSTWGRGQTAVAETLDAERWLEQAVSEFLAATTVAWVDIADESGPASDRAFIERNSIALLVRGVELNVPGNAWLGRLSDRAAIARSGIWNVDHTEAIYDPRFIGVFTEYADMAVADKSNRAAEPLRPSLAPPDWRTRTNDASCSPTLW